MFSQEDNDKVTAILKDYCKVEKTPEEIAEREMSELTTKIRSYKIPGFFPTPDKLIDVMFDNARVFQNTFMNFLEPSAGIGSIAERIRDLKQNHKVVCCEIYPDLSRILELKGFTVASPDIFEMTTLLEDKENGNNHKHFDRIVMNPPFEKGQDMKHIQYCYENFLKPTGILVSVASNSVMTNTQKKYVAFQEFVAKHGQFIKLEGGEFKDAFNSTGVSSCLVVLRGESNEI